MNSQHSNNVTPSSATVGPHSHQPKNGMKNFQFKSKEQMTRRESLDSKNSAPIVALGSNDSENAFRSTQLLKNMMQSHRNRNPYHDYVVLGLIGTGSIGSVEKVVRKHRTHGHGEISHEEDEETQKEEWEEDQYRSLFDLFGLFQNCKKRESDECCFGPAFLAKSFRPKNAVETTENGGQQKVKFQEDLVDQKGDGGLQKNLSSGTASTSLISKSSLGEESSMSIISESSNFSAPPSLDVSPSKTQNGSSNTSTVSPEKQPDSSPKTPHRNSSLQDFQVAAHPLEKPQHQLRKYALKSIIMSRAEPSKGWGKRNETKGISADDEKELRNEINILRSLDHPNIVSCIEVYEFRRMIYLVLDLCEGGDLYVLDPYTEREAAFMMKQICEAVGFMHRRGVVHRDLKHENVMFVHRKSKERRLEIKVIDFGLSMKYGNRSLDETMDDFVGTIYTMAPEVLRGNYTYKCDIWSMGVMAYMLLSSEIPFCGRDMQEIARKIARGTYVFDEKHWSHISRQAKDFVASLLIRDASSRPDGDQALRHPWLAGRKHQFSTKLHRRHSSECIGGLSSSFMQLNPKLSLDADIFKSIEKYSNYSWLHRLALMIIAYKYTDEQTAQLRQIFASYDDDQSGNVSVNELKEAFILHDKYSEKAMDQIFLAVDMNGSGKISWTEFLAATIETTGLIREEDFSEAFDQLDYDRNGYLNASDLREICGKDLPQDIIDQIIDESDVTRDQKIERDEFLALAKETYFIEKRRSQPIHLRRSSSLGDLDPSQFRDMSELSMDVPDSEPTGESQFSVEKAKSVRKARNMLN